MKTQIVHISKLQTSKVSNPWSMPLLYTAFGFIFTFLGAWIYNGIAGWIGGIEFTVSDGTND